MTQTSPAAATPPHKKHFAHQLAQFSLYAPFFVMLISCATNGAFRNTGTVSITTTALGIMIIAGLNLLLLLASIVTGVVALCFVPRLGAKWILWRAIVGILFSSLFLAGTAYLVLMPSGAANTQKRLVGDWYSTVSSAAGTAHVKMTLNADETSRWEMVDGPRPMSIKGHWRVAAPTKFSSDLSLQIKFDTPEPNLPGVEGLGWRIESLDASRLELATKDAQGNPTRETYTRTP